MSASIPPPPPAAPARTTLDVAGTPATPFGRLVRVEWRKMFDTRGGLWLMIITGGLLALVAGLVLLIVALNDGAVITAGDLTSVFTFPVSLLMPVFAILTVTSEWSQRTALTSFTLEPHRMRVVASKWVAVSGLALATIAVAVLFGALTNVLGAVIAGTDVQWDVEAGTLGWTIVLQLLYFWMAFAVAMLLLNTPAAISVYYVVALLVPLVVWGPLFALFDWARDVLPWVDLTVASAPVINGRDFAGQPVDAGALEYLQFVWTAVLWIGLPLLLGALRIRRAEVK
ncbi:hypothetical protein KUV85_00990 [Nocardioides panacisoli]|uniref:hypothetical protein n=1 Tax=Nocardioides panacisoli TaxID=627624 RepID=UPI001C63A9A1|nr:hypothetical protein [Nocardioides panacisoli]QYJ04288.1 hypothetical protein KUV85_00990 [Nocardioides panacisoli]